MKPQSMIVLGISVLLSGCTLKMLDQLSQASYDFKVRQARKGEVLKETSKETLEPTIVKVSPIPEPILDSKLEAKTRE